MEDMQRSNRGRVYSLKPNATIYTGFAHKYVSHLLPALTKATNIFSCGGNKDENMEKMVRFEVDMALVLSASGFKWSHALKHKLEQRVSSNQLLHQFAPYQSSILRVNKHKTLVDHLRTPLSIPKPLVPTKANGPKRTCRRRSYNKKTRGEKEFGCRIRILRRILPGGNEMGLCELLSEVESYVICLQLQVNVLKSLVETL
ncbi:transcription factor bHLH146 [Elaeis guineensis]|uniref:Transcription factor bHLH146 n=1 Tax=Elaeis guineensis var. tenera TaxID=51953 RepID=A0A6I9RL63_ELAGV|nr:transcription factor bHLH146 [Elaeis guineensis]